MNSLAQVQPLLPFHSLEESRIQRQFERFHRDNPHVYDVLVRLTREAKQRGKDKIGIAMLWEVMRWELFILTNSADEFKLNNNHKSRYARLIMRQEKDLANIFDLRELRA